MKRGNTHKVELSKKYFLLLRNFELAQKEYNRKYYETKQTQQIT